MRNLESWARKIFSYHLAVLRTKNLSRDNIELTVQIGGGITIVFPLFLATVVMVLLLTPKVGLEMVQTPILIALLVIVFGAMRITDKIYDQNMDDIQALASEIKLSPTKGTWWAARQLLKLYVGYLVTAGVVFLLIRQMFGS